jgi:hypothetical protein
MEMNKAFHSADDVCDPSSCWVRRRGTGGDFCDTVCFAHRQDGETKHFGVDILLTTHNPAHI